MRQTEGARSGEAEDVTERENLQVQPASGLDDGDVRHGTSTAIDTAAADGSGVHILLLGNGFVNAIVLASTGSLCS